jgi:hypothetical protein
VSSLADLAELLGKELLSQTTLAYLSRSKGIHQSEGAIQIVVLKGCARCRVIQG